MANNQDARPFADLKKDAEEFRTKFDEDIKECINFLDAQITALICDPDSVRTSGRDVRQNALVDFSKAKYDIFIGVKSLINKKEKEWLNYVSEMKKLFVENVEIFLAGTKLEVKLPSDVQLAGPRKSPGNRKSTYVPSSDFPITYNIARNISGLSSPPRNQDTSKEISIVGNKVQSNRGSRLSMKINSPPNTSAAILQKDNSYSFESSSDEAIGVNTSAYKNEISDSSEISEDEGKTKVVQPNKRGRPPATSIKLAKSPRDKREEIEDFEMDTEESGLVLPPRNDISDNQATRKPRMLKRNIPVSLDQNITVSRPGRGRRGKQAVQNVKLVDEVKNTTEDVSENGENGGDSSASEQTDMQESNFSGAIVEAETVKASSNPVRGRRGRPGSKNKVKDSKESEIAKNAGSVVEEEPAVEIVSAKVRRGISAVPKDSENSDSDVEIASTNARRGRPAVAKNSQESSTDVEIASTNARRGRPAVAKNSKESSTDVEIASTNARRGRPAVAKHSKESSTDISVIPKTSGRGRKSVKNISETNETYESDINLHVTRPGKSIAPSKSWKEILEDMSGNDMVPSTPARTMSKRKTISSASEFEPTTPSKRLKASARKSLAAVQDAYSANDNLLESDENYSDWMALRNIDGRVPTHPAIYEVKVWRAKKPAYIGFCESFHQKSTLYKMKQNSGHKQLDKFVERNYDDIQIRYEVVTSVSDAKAEVKNRIKSFISQYKTTPAYN